MNQRLIIKSAATATSLAWQENTYPCLLFTEPSLQRSDFAIDHTPKVVVSSSEVTDKGWFNTKSAALSPRQLLDRAQALEKKSIEEGLDFVYDAIDQKLGVADYGIVDAILREASNRQLSIDLYLALLTITLPARNFLTQRASFVNIVEELIKKERGTESVHELLAGLV